MHDHSVSTHMVCSAIAGFVAAVVGSPVDVLKTRIMNSSVISFIRFFFHFISFLLFFSNYISQDQDLNIKEFLIVLLELFKKMDFWHFIR